MPKRLKSQWEFGELFPAEAIRKTLTVSELTGSIRRTLEKEFGTVSVLGEITNLRVQSSGHIYFTIKDATAQLACVLFRNESRAVNREYLRDGQKVVIEGEITVYEARGQYQLIVYSVQLQGLGALQAAFERLKRRLQAEGLFDQSHKRPLPTHAGRIGLITSPVGAAMRDVLHTIERRDPSLGIVIVPCRVQGAGAAQEIAAAINLLNDWAAKGEQRKLDLILITRGGGSLEDLWAFNEEIVARAIYSSPLPVISAVGHEIDFTISDFVADFRAATPTAAAEIITEGVFAARPFIEQASRRLSEQLRYAMEKKRAELEDVLRHLARAHPKRRITEQSQRLDDLYATVSRCARHHFCQKQAAFQGIQLRLGRVRPKALVQQRKERTVRATERLIAQAKTLLGIFRERFRRADAQLRLLSPDNVLNRGYSITTAAGTGKVIRDPKEVAVGEEIISRVQHGRIRSVRKEGDD